MNAYGQLCNKIFLGNFYKKTRLLTEKKEPAILKNTDREAGEVGMWILPATVCMTAMAFFYLCRWKRFCDAEKGKAFTRGRSIAYKCIPTLCAALLCLTGCLHRPEVSHWWLFAGLCLCALADGVLDGHFLSGMGLFALGHGCYIAAFCIAGVPTWGQGMIFLVLAGLLLGISPCIKRRWSAHLRFPLAWGVLYGLVLLAMVSLSLGGNGLQMSGALLFAVSDAVLALMILGVARGKIVDNICLVVYYLAQYLLGLSVFF